RRSTRPISSATASTTMTATIRPRPIGRPTPATPPTRRASARSRRRSYEHGVRVSGDRKPPRGGRLDPPPDRHDRPPDDRRPGLPASPGHGPREELGLLRGPAAVPRDVGLRLRLPGAPGAAGVHRLRRAWRGDDRVLAERDLDDGPAAVVGEEPGKPRALLRRADEHHVGAVR